MKNILILVLLALLSVGVASAGTSMTAKYLGFNHAFGTLDMQINVSTTENGDLVYVENYYSTDSHGNLKYYSGDRYELSGSEIFGFQRPKDGHGVNYYVVEKILTNNGKIVYKKFIDLSKK